MVCFIRRFYQRISVSNIWLLLFTERGPLRWRVQMCLCASVDNVRLRALELHGNYLAMQLVDFLLLQTSIIFLGRRCLHNLVGFPYSLASSSPSVYRAARLL
jgi:hypothetical protein